MAEAKMVKAAHTFPVMFVGADNETGRTRELGSYKLPGIPDVGDLIDLKDCTYEVLGRSWNIAPADEESVDAGLVIVIFLDDSEEDDYEDFPSPPPAEA